jgi:hypothetical protein
MQDKHKKVDTQVLSSQLPPNGEQTEPEAVEEVCITTKNF